MQKSPEWQSAGGPHNSFQPIIQMGIAIQTALLQVPLLSPWDGFTGRGSPGLYLTLQRAARLFICCLRMREKEQAVLRKQHGNSKQPQSLSGVIMAGMVAVSPEQSRQKDWPECASSPPTHTHTPAPVTGKCPWCNGSLTHWFDKVSPWLQPQIDYLTGLADVACGPHQPSGWCRLHLFKRFEIQWSSRKRTPNCCKASKTTKDYRGVRKSEHPGCHSHKKIFQGAGEDE